ncbi:Hypothetical protein A7982_05178 [Minicystis rosea]|nr:Hypothetical protein A7982_05178 [Minicystis rosea]
MIEIDVSDVDRCSGALQELYDRTLVAVIVRGVFSTAVMADVVDRLERGEIELPRINPPVFKGHVLGRPLVAADETLTNYLDDAERFRTGCKALFGAPVDERVQQVLAGLAGGRPVVVPTAEDGRSYLAATIRVLVEGDRLPLHYENETFKNPVMKRLGPSLDRASLLSYYIPMAMPDGGGELRIYPIDCLEGGDSLIHRLGGDDKARPLFEERGFDVLRPGVGDMLVFDGGRLYHEVTPVRGRARWTMGGFFAPSSDHRRICFWS